MEGPSGKTPRFGSRFFAFIKTTFLGGFLVLVPLAVLLSVIQIVESGQIERLSASTAKVAQCIARYGVGSSQLMLQGTKEEESAKV